VVCRDSYHHDEDGYAERGFHLVGESVLVPNPGGDGKYHLEWTGHRPENGPVRVSGMTVPANRPSGFPPVKSWVGNDGVSVWRFRCSCGDDRQRSEPDIMAIISALLREFPGKPCEIPMERLLRK
jgi:hypothetical protein